MLPPLDVFLQTDEGILWQGSAENFDIAKLSVQKLMASTPGTYVIYSQTTGAKTTIKADGSTSFPLAVRRQN